MNKSNNQLESSLISAITQGYDLAELTKAINNVKNVNYYKHKDGSTPLLIAVREGNIEAVKLLINAGAEVNLPHGDPAYKYTALHNAASYGHLEIVKLLIDRGAEVNAVDAQNRTPLYNAAKHNYPETVSFLILKNANLDIKQVDGISPLEIAKRMGHNDVSDILNKEEHIVENIQDTTTNSNNHQGLNDESVKDVNISDKEEETHIIQGATNQSTISPEIPSSDNSTKISTETPTTPTDDATTTGPKNGKAKQMSYLQYGSISGVMLSLVLNGFASIHGQYNITTALPKCLEQYCSVMSSVSLRSGFNLVISTVVIAGAFAALGNVIDKGY